jgi:hypothetical protein
LASKQKYEDAHPKRMRKHHGKENKLASQKKYRESENGRRVCHEYYMANKERNMAKRKAKLQQELENQLQGNPEAMTPESASSQIFQAIPKRKTVNWRCKLLHASESSVLVPQNERTHHISMSSSNQKHEPASCAFVSSNK